MAPPPIPQRQCYLSVQVYDTDYDEPNEFILHTFANGEKVHGRCTPLDGIAVDGRGFFECASMVALPPSPDGTYTFVTTATPAVDENPHEGSFVYVEYMVDCEGTCQPPSAPPLPPTCSYSATPAGGGNGGGVEGGWQSPSQSIMYSTYTKLPS